MAAWAVIKDLKIDLSDMSDKNVEKLVKSFSKEEVDEIIADLAEAADSNIQVDEIFKTALAIAKYVLTSGLLA